MVLYPNVFCCVEDCHPVRLKGVHVINTVPIIDSCLAVVKPLMQSEIMQLVSILLTYAENYFNTNPLLSNYDNINLFILISGKAAFTSHNINSCSEKKKLNQYKFINIGVFSSNKIGLCFEK